MKTKMTHGARLAAMAGLIAVAGWAAGCATTGAPEPAGKTRAESVGAAGGSNGAEPSSMASAAVGKGDFYAEWYDASAVVLPPPPVGNAK